MTPKNWSSYISTADVKTDVADYSRLKQIKADYSGKWHKKITAANFFDFFGQINPSQSDEQYDIKSADIERVKSWSQRADANFDGGLDGFIPRLDEAVELDSSPTLWRDMRGVA